MMKWGMGMLIGLCCAFQVSAQPNLVPNPSFEIYTECPSSSGLVEYAHPWHSILGTVDYYHECGVNGWGIPISVAGGGYARTGQAYIGLGLSYMGESAARYREFVGTPLLTPLDSNTRYYVKFYVSLTDSMWYACKNIGIYFSADNPITAGTNGDDVIDSLLAMNPQVCYTGDFITDKEDWTKVEGVFVAQGGEDFITIGNFDQDSIVETVFVSGGGVIKPWAPDYWRRAYYFIDDVSVIPVDSLVGMEGQLSVGNNRLAIHPNPASEYFIIETAHGSGTLVLYDAVGKEVLSVALHLTRQGINVGGIPAGVYVAVVEREGVVVGRRKVVVQ